VELQWADDTPIELHSDELNLPQFALIGYSANMCAEEYKTGKIRRISATLYVSK